MNMFYSGGGFMVKNKEERLKELYRRKEYLEEQIKLTVDKMNSLGNEEMKELAEVYNHLNSSLFDVEIQLVLLEGKEEFMKKHGGV